MPIETHPFKIFDPGNANNLILGSFASRQVFTDETYDWYYGTERNQFWLILEAVYQKVLRSKEEKQALFRALGIAIADIIYQCERKDGSNLDTNLVNIVYNQQPIENTIDGSRIENIYFTSRFVEKRFKKEFKDVLLRHPGIKLICLPSPSPRYARMSKEEKIARYKELLPDLKSSFY